MRRTAEAKVVAVEVDLEVLGGQVEVASDVQAQRRRDDPGGILYYRLVNYQP